MTTIKKKTLEKSERDLVQRIFYVDQQNSMPGLKIEPIIHDDMRKLKPVNEFTRAFRDYNQRHFTLNLDLLLLFYTPEELYTMNQISYIPLEELKYISDKPHYPINSQNEYWKEGITLYLNDRFIILLMKTQIIYHRWLDHLELIRFKYTGKTILLRYKTLYKAPPQISMIQKIIPNPQIIIQDDKTQHKSSQLQKAQQNPVKPQVTQQNQQITQSITNSQIKKSNEQKSNEQANEIQKKFDEKFQNVTTDSQKISDQQIDTQPQYNEVKSKIQNNKSQNQTNQDMPVFHEVLQKSHKPVTPLKHQTPRKTQDAQQIFQQRKSIESIEDIGLNRPGRVIKKTNNFKETGNINQKDDPLEVKNQKEKIMKELEIQTEKYNFLNIPMGFLAEKNCQKSDQAKINTVREPVRIININNPNEKITEQTENKAKLNNYYQSLPQPMILNSHIRQKQRVHSQNPQSTPNSRKQIRAASQIRDIWGLTDNEGNTFQKPKAMEENFTGRNDIHSPTQIQQAPQKKKNILDEDDFDEQAFLNEILGNSNDKKTKIIDLENLNERNVNLPQSNFKSINELNAYQSLPQKPDQVETSSLNLNIKNKQKQEIVQFSNYDDWDDE